VQGINGATRAAILACAALLYRRGRWSLRLTAINLTNKVALYNFLSTFSGTHFVTPRNYTAELGFHF
jgi:outer membrane receptor protein involved in Fe transport